ncbi:MAG: hypothetical protein WBP12_02085 [Candidatus Saccharimonas sp.]
MSEPALEPESFYAYGSALAFDYLRDRGVQLEGYHDGHFSNFPIVQVTLPQGWALTDTKNGSYREILDDQWRTIGILRLNSRNDTYHLDHTP